MTKQVRDRADRTLGQVIAIGGLILVVGIAAGDIRGLRHFSDAWLFLCGAIVVALAVLAGASHILPIRVLRFAWMMIPVASAVALMTTYLAYSGPSPDLLLSWQTIATPAVLGFFVLWLPPKGAVAASIIVCVLPALASLLSLGPVLTVGVLNTFNQLTGVGIVLLLITIHIRLYEFRAAEAETENEELRRADATARAAEEARVAQFVHDEVLSSLSAAMYANGTPSPALRDSARLSLRALERWSHGAIDSATDVSGAEFGDQLRDIAHTLDRNCMIEGSVTETSVPAEVTEALVAAASEALRNSVRHAGEEATRTLRTYIDDGLARIEIVDDGIGFDPAAVSPRRFGVQGSILAAVRAVPACSATVVSTPGRGTRVVLQWLS